jgi:hypothetical protein
MHNRLSCFAIVPMQQVVVNGENGSCGYCEERSFVFDLPKEFGRK